jgi:hypothetical protein
MFSSCGSLPTGNNRILGMVSLKSIRPNIISFPVTDDGVVKRLNLLFARSGLSSSSVQSQEKRVASDYSTDEVSGEADKERKRKIIASRSELKRVAPQPAPIPISFSILSLNSGPASRYIPQRH